MPGGLFRIIATAVAAIGLCHAAVAAGGKQPRHRLAAEPAPHADPAAPDRDRRRSSLHRSELDTPGQTTVLTRETLDDMNATTLRDALRSTAGVTVGR
jgi:outer membrane receptor for monomeric catechols